MRFVFAAVLVMAITAPVRADAPATDSALARASTSPDKQAPKWRSLFDPSRHMRVDEVKPGMTGYGLSVFKGTKIERFDVEVLSVLKNFNPKYDVILIRCSGANLEHTGAIAGMSGSPIYLEDESGRFRMVGAFAYGWPLVKDPVGGVQPIEYMLELPAAADASPAVAGAAQAKPRDGASTTAEPRSRIRWEMDHLVLPQNDRTPQDLLAASLRGRDATRDDATLTFAGDADTPQLQPLTTPLMTAGLSSKLIEEFAPIFRAHGFTLLQSGGIGGSSPIHGEPADLEPGSVLAAPMLTGDIDMTAIGTCTETIGDYVFGFGHSFNNEGDIAMPMGSGQIDAVIANLRTSFKLGTLTKLRGTLTADQTVGIAGSKGEIPPTIPIELRVAYTDGRPAIDYHFDAARHPRMTPLITGMALANALSGAQDLPQHHSVEFDLNFEFENGQKLRLNNVVVNTSPAQMFLQVVMPLMTAADNPFERVLPTKVTGTLQVTPEARDAQILSINVPREKYRPGETVRAWVTYRPFRAAEAVMPVDIELPAKLPDGEYQLVLSDAQRYLSDEQQSKPFRFTAESAEEVFAVLQEAGSIRRDAIYVRLLRQSDGVAIGRTAMSHLPSSRRQVLLGAGRSNTTPFMNSTVKVIPTQHVMSGAADFTITVDSETRVEVAGAREHTAPEGPPPPPTVEDAAPVPDVLPEPPASPTPSPGGDEEAPGESPADGAENS